MDPKRRFVLGSLGLAAVALAHALATWTLRSVAALFIGGAAIAFAAEVAVVRLGLLRHHVRPRVAGVPLAVVPAWPATVYAFYRAASLVVPAGVEAAALAAVAATAFDVVADPLGVSAGHWSYPDSPASRPRLGGVPWWNFVGWSAIVFATAMLPGAVG